MKYEKLTLSSLTIKAALKALADAREEARLNIINAMRKHGPVSFPYAEEMKGLTDEEKQESRLDQQENEGMAIIFSPGMDVRSFSGFVEEIAMDEEKNEVMIKGFIPAGEGRNKHVDFSCSVLEVEDPESLIRFIEEYA